MSRLTAGFAEGSDGMAEKRLGAAGAFGGSSMTPIAGGGAGGGAVSTVGIISSWGAGADFWGCELLVVFAARFVA